MARRPRPDHARAPRPAADAGARRSASAAERVSDAAVHLAGLGLVAVAVPVLILVTAHARPDAAALFGVAVYGAALAAMIAASAVYHLARSEAWPGLWKRLDHSAIYVKIAGTYTPFTALTGQGLVLTAALWGAAALGVALKLAAPERFRWLSLALYLGMGWAAAVAGQTMLAALPGPVIALMVAGGLLYTVGVVFHLWRDLPFATAIWHLCVLVASGLFYLAVTALVLAD